MENNDSNQVKHKRKRKKTFLKNAKKYAKKGCYGRGSQLDADTYQYFVRIMEVHREGFENEEDKKLFVENVFKQTENEEINCSCNQVGCRVIEMLLPFANDLVIERYMTVFAPELRPLCTDRFASHVLEALLTQCCLRSLNKDNSNDIKEKFKNFTIKISNFLLNNLEEFIWDTYGNHIIRSVFRNLVQMPNKDEKSDKNKPSENKIKYDIPEDYENIIKEYAERLIVWPQFKDLPYTDITSGLLQVLIKALEKIDLKLLKKYIKTLLNDSFCVESSIDDETLKDPKKWPEVFMSKSALMLLEIMIETTIPKYYTQIYTKCFKGHIYELAITRSTNFAVQKLLSHSTEKVHFEVMFEELSDNFENIISAGHTGVILALAQTCQRLIAKQGNFVQSLMKALHCEPEERQNDFLICLCKFVTFEQLQNLNINNYEKEKFNLHGTLILQLILEFNKPIKLVNAILDMNTNDLKSLFCNTMGSHIVDSFAKSKFIGEKSREKLIRKLQHTYRDLTINKYGSRSFEAIWNVANMKFKMNIMDELVQKDAAWSNSEFGKIIASKINLGLYKRNKEEWKNSFNNITKLEKLTDLLK